MVLRREDDASACGDKIAEKTVDPESDSVYIQDCHPRGLIAQ